MYLYILSNYEKENFICFRAIKVKEETEKEYITEDKINILNYEYSISKEVINKEYDNFFIANNRRRLKKQAERLYKTFDNKTQYEIDKLKYIQSINNRNYEDILKSLK